MSEEKKIPPEEIPQKQQAETTISSAEPITKVEQSEIPPSSGTEQQQTTNLASEA